MDNLHQTPQPKRLSLWERCGDSTPRDRQNSMRILWAVAAWVICLLGTKRLIKHDLVTDGVISWLIATLPVVAGISVIFAYRRYLYQADELQRMIHLRALAAGFAAGWLAISCYPLFERIGAPAVDTATFGAVMAVSYALGVLLGGRRFW